MSVACDASDPLLPECFGGVWPRRLQPAPLRREQQGQERTLESSDEFCVGMGMPVCQLIGEKDSLWQLEMTQEHLMQKNDDMAIWQTAKIQLPVLIEKVHGESQDQAAELHVFTALEHKRKDAVWIFTFVRAHQN